MWAGGHEKEAIDRVPGICGKKSLVFVREIESEVMGMDQLRLGAERQSQKGSGS